MTGVQILAAALVVIIGILVVIIVRVIAKPAGVTMTTATYAGCCVGFVLGLLICALGAGWCFSEPESAREYGGLVAIAGAITAAGSGLAAALLCRSHPD
jgi:drug/metabolite transporter (DMT)-like permease